MLMLHLHPVSVFQVTNAKTLTVASPDDVHLKRSVKQEFLGKGTIDVGSHEGDLELIEGNLA